MEEKLSKASILYGQIRAIRGDLDSYSLHGTTVFIPHFNSLLERTRQLFSTDQNGSSMLEAIATVKSMAEIDRNSNPITLERIKKEMLSGCGLLLSALDGYKLSVEGESTPVTQTKEFTFINSSELRKILERDYQEIQRAFIAQCWKSVIILSGGSIEAILMDLLMKNQSAALGAARAPKGKSDITTWDLVHVINVSVDIELVSSSIDRLSHSVREYRNLIHPGNEMRSGLTFDKEEAGIAFEVLNMVYRDCS